MIRALALVVVALSSCRGPDYVEGSIYKDEGLISGSRGNNYDQGREGVMLTTGWSIGQQGAAFKNLAALDVSKAGVLRTDTYQSPAPVLVVDHGHKEEAEEDPEAEGLGKLWAALGSTVLVLGGLLVSSLRSKPAEA